jgi:predicted  nucleic acid-binding Zn-ribbon protein
MENETKETQEPQNNAPVAEDLEAIKAELEEEKKTKAAAETSLAEKDARIADLQAQLSEAKRGFESTTAEFTAAKQAKEQAVSKYLEAARALNSTIPKDVIAGAVKANLEAQAKEAKVPAGAPTRGEISLEGLSPREKIAAGIQQSRAPTA